MVEQKQVDGAVGSESGGSQSVGQVDGKLAEAVDLLALPWSLDGYDGDPATEDCDTFHCEGITSSDGLSVGRPDDPLEGEFIFYDGRQVTAFLTVLNSVPHLLARLKVLEDAAKIGLRAASSCAYSASYHGDDSSEDYWDRQEQLIKDALAASPAQAPALSSSEGTATQSDSTKEEV